jgi:hypothetical protein
MRSIQQIIMVITLVVLLFSITSYTQSTTTNKYPAVTTPPETVFELMRENDREVARQFYSKYIDVKGLPVLASVEVADLALQRTYEIVTHMLAGRISSKQWSKAVCT